MTWLLAYLRLPAEVSSFETAYLARMNRIALAFFWLHPPAFVVVALLAGTSPAVAAALSLGAVIGPTIAYAALRARPRAIGLVYGFTATMMGGVLVYIGQGPMQIEMHFYFFVLIALLAVFGNPLVVVVAAATVAAHHGAMWVLLPRGVFNYDASLWAIAVHAIFVALESVAACFVARSFFDNVIGLERIVLSRTADLDARNRDMALILDNVAQGFATVDLDGSIGAERSRSLAGWFGEPAPGARWWDYIAESDDSAAWLELCFQSLAGPMPADVVLDQMPKRMERGGRHFALEYRPLGALGAGVQGGLLAVVTDVTGEVARQRAESAQRELISVVEKANRDRAGFAAFAAEAEELIARCTAAGPGSLTEHRRALHTLKGNAGLFGATSIAELCHELESALEEQCEPLVPAQRGLLSAAWAAFRRRVDPVLGLSKRRTIVIDWAEYQSVISSLAPPEPSWVAALRRWGMDPARPHLERLGEQARALCRRLGKADLAIDIEDGDVRLDGERFAPLWAALVHAVRNAVDHGIEAPEVRRAAGKPAAGRLRLATHIEHGHVTIELTDDGAGVDWTRVQVRARALGLPADTPHQLEEALFASGLSTAQEVTDVSGRGAGLDALRAACRELGGSVELSSARGLGSVLRCTIPAGAQGTAVRPAA